MNSSIGENRSNLNNFLNNECVNIYVTWYRLNNFLLVGRDADIIDLNYKKEWNILSNNQIISGDYSKTPFLALLACLTAFSALTLLVSLHLYFRNSNPCRVISPRHNFCKESCRSHQERRF